MRTITVALLLLILMSGLAWADTTFDPLAKDANTPEQHMMVAKLYDSMASEMERKADMHRVMAANASDHALTKGNMQTHCNLLRAWYLKQARIYRDLAKKQRALGGP